ETDHARLVATDDVGGDETRAGRDVQHASLRREVQAADELVAPAAVLAEPEDRRGRVVAASDVVEQAPGVPLPLRGCTHGAVLSQLTWSGHPRAVAMMISVNTQSDLDELVEKVRARDRRTIAPLIWLVEGGS